MKKNSDLPEIVHREVEKIVKRMLGKSKVDPRVIDSTAIGELAEGQKDKGEFYANFYSLLILNFAEQTTLDRGKAWVEFIEEVAVSQATSQEKPEEFLGNFYSLVVEYIAMSKIIDKESTDAWLDFIEEKVERQSKNHRDPEEFMQNFYNMVLTKLVEIKLISVSSEFITENFVEEESPKEEQGPE